MENNGECFLLERISLKKADEQFPGCITEDLKEVDLTNRLEPGYHKLGIYNGKLYSSTYEIGWIGWSVWNGKAWRDLDDADNALFQRFLEAKSFTWK